jgi:cardiolipin synthase
MKNYLSIALDDDLTNYILKKYKFFHRVSPNTVTLLGLLLNFVIFYCIVEGLFFVSALLLIIRYLADCLDGGIARMYNKKSKLGGFLDTVSDNILLFLSSYAIFLLYKVPFGLLISLSITFTNIVIMYSNNSLVDHWGIKGDVKKSLCKSIYVFLVNNSFLLFIFKIIIIYLSRYFSFADFS